MFQSDLLVTEIRHRGQGTVLSCLARPPAAEGAPVGRCWSAGRQALTFRLDLQERPSISRDLTPQTLGVGMAAPEAAVGGHLGSEV